MARGRHALVTGGGSGVGAAIALALAGAGAVVTICGRRKEPLQDVAARHENIHGLTADVTDEDSLQQLYEQARAARGDFGIVVANAGMSESAPAHATSLEMWQTTITVNLTGAFLSVRPVLKPMRAAGWGRVIFIASTAGLKGYPYVAPYVAAKHGVIGLMRALATETAKTGVTVNAICPGFTETPMLAESVKRIATKTGRSEGEARDALAASNPQGRLIQPGEVAEAALWLCSENSGSVTGQAISVSGGEI